MSGDVCGVSDGMDYQILQAVCDEDTLSSSSVGMSDLSDEILLCILRHIPVCDLLLNVANVCQKLNTLCHDKTLLTHVSLSEDYWADDALVRRILKQLANHVQSLSLNGCYWLSGSTMEHIARCRGVTHLDVTGCRITSIRLSRLLSSLAFLKSLAFDVAPGFNSAQLSSEAVDALSRLSELRQMLLTPSYGVVPCCAQLRKLMLQFDIPDVTKEGVGVCCQLMVGQSSVPHYKQLEEFTARLAPGEVNQTLLLLYLAVFSVNVPKHLRVFLVSIPGPNPAPWPAAPSVAQSLGERGDLVALQLPRSWLDSASLKQALEGNSPKHLSFSRCPALWPQVFQSLLNSGVRDATQLGLKKVPRVGLQNYKPASESSVSGDSTSGLALLLAGCLFLETFELIGPGFASTLPRLEPCTRASVEPRGMCAWARGIGDAHLAVLEALPQLRRLTLAGLPGVLRGTGLVQLAKQCRDLRVLSLANLGSLKTMNYTAALLDTLKQCTQLQELRLEQPYLNANASFFEALSCCSRLQRVCLISRCGTFDPSATETFMERCCHVVMCHMFMGGTLVMCRTLQKALLDRFSAERPALSVVIYPLQHEDLPSVIRDIPLTLLDRITLFQSHVAQPPHLSPL
ncbi:F-box/LRR-repeat protein 18 isoform X3 [Haplochromis burtoni]|uniref:F-box/LRR-repeat protein 18 isoform X3 n=1 Tax=Haplochromis burtoni TaxID=8153 RepID=UPI0003BD72AE|nr:F-box/LRR-repeat protein 18 isoform X3 [Haplochromis burtoni]